MGLYDEFYKRLPSKGTPWPADFDYGLAVQLKVHPHMGLYAEGDKVQMEDGVYIGLDGYVVINRGTVVLVTDQCFDNHGDPIDFEQVKHDLLGWGREHDPPL